MRGKSFGPALLLCLISAALPLARAAELAGAYERGRDAFFAKNYELATRELETAVRAEPESSRDHYWLGRALGEEARTAGIFSQARLARRVKAEFEKSVELDPQNLDARFALMQFHAIAPALMGGSRSESVRQADELRRRSPLRGHAAFGFLFAREKKWTEAEAEYQAARREFPAEADPVYWLVYFYQSRQRYDDAFQLLDERLAALPAEPRAQFELGRTSAFSGLRLDRAEECLRKYLERPADRERPSPGSAHYWLGRVLERKGDTPLARSEYRRALELEPNNPEAKKALGL